MVKKVVLALCLPTAIALVLTNAETPHPPTQPAAPLPIRIEPNPTPKKPKYWAPPPIFATQTYKDLQDYWEIENALRQPRCWSALGAASADEALRSAAAFRIHFQDLSAYHLRDGTPILAQTDGSFITWDLSVGNPHYPLATLLVEQNWKAAFQIRVPLTGAKFGKIVFLHELGHRLGGLPKDWDAKINNANTLKVLRSCAPDMIPVRLYTGK